MEVRGLMSMFLICYIFGHIIISYNNGFIEAKSQFDDLEIEKKLKAMNKPAVKIIKTIDGERYGCVDFFKQPAFDHPSMKNHSYHYKMRPIGFSEVMRERKTNNSDNEFGYLWENGVGCPIGTVPIRRVTRDDLLTLNSLGYNSMPRGSWNNTTYDPNDVLHYDQHHYAVGRTKNIGMSYNGATMEVCITAPKVKPTQFSSSRLHIQIGDDFIQTGLTVNPALYKDHQPRDFVFTKVGGKSCYNSHCDIGMISVRQDYPMGTALKHVSVRGASETHFAFFGIIKDQANGNWWLEYGRNSVEIGFWPSKMFRQSSGNLVEWGGEVYSASLPSPEMGFGFFPIWDIYRDTYVKRISILDGNYHFDRVINEVEEFSDDRRGYNVKQFIKSQTGAFGHYILFGGPGNI